MDPGPHGGPIHTESGAERPEKESPMTTTAITTADRYDIDALRARLTGEALAPGDEGWDEARQAWNLHADQRPELVVMAATADDIQAAVEHAREHGLRVAPQGTGHGAGAMGDLSGALLLRMARMRGVEIDAERRIARVQPGALWMDVTVPAAEHGLAALAGSSPDVGVVGYTLGGGMSWLARRYGLAANSVVAVELVTAGGRHVRVDRDNEPDLFWAVRGGGGSFGVVTALEFRLYPLASIYAGSLFWPIERAGEILRAWRAWTDTVPEDLTSCGRILQLPPLPDIPEPLRGRGFVLVEMAYVGSEEDGAELVRPLRELGPEMDTLATIPMPALSHMHMDPDHPVPGTGDGMMLDELPLEAIDRLVEVAGPGSGSPLLSLEIRQLGGALARSGADHGAFDSVEADFVLFGVGIAMTPEMADAVKARVELVIDTLATWDAQRAYLNFAERTGGDVERFFSPWAYRRLRQVRRTYDPAGLFQATTPFRPLDRPARPRTWYAEAVNVRPSTRTAAARPSA
jgi:hypothetical protein